MSTINQRITIDPELCGGQPCIRSMRIRVIDVLDLLTAGLSFQDILDEMPDLEIEDIKSAISFARNRLNHPVIAV
ncbi:DUF433 domain-containing protein [Bacteroidota bacterium]